MPYYTATVDHAGKYHRDYKKHNHDAESQFSRDAKNRYVIDNRLNPANASSLKCVVKSEQSRVPAGSTAI
jgi:hypothetical protein